MNAPQPLGDPGDRALPVLDVAVRLERVTYAYPGSAGDAALRDVSLTLPAGARLGVLGPNGGGKTTLLKLILGMLEPSAGRIEVLGQPPRSARLGGSVGSLPQRSGLERHFPVCARDLLLLSAAHDVAPWRPVPRDRRDAAERALSLVGAAGFASRPIGTLSGGQLQRVLVARAIVTSPRLLVLDEPTTGVDVAGQSRFHDMLLSLHGQLGLTVIVVTHELRTIAALCDRVACLNRTMHTHTSPSGLTPAVLAEVFQHEIDVAFARIDHARAGNADRPADGGQSA